MGAREDPSLKRREEGRTASQHRFVCFYMAWLLGTELTIPVIMYLRLSFQGWPRQVALAWAAASWLILIPPDLIAVRFLRRALRGQRNRQYLFSQQTSAGSPVRSSVTAQDVHHRTASRRRRMWVMTAFVLAFVVLTPALAYVGLLPHGWQLATVGAVITGLFWVGVGSYLLRGIRARVRAAERSNRAALAQFEATRS